MSTSDIKKLTCRKIGSFLSQEVNCDLLHDRKINFAEKS